MTQNKGHHKTNKVHTMTRQHWHHCHLTIPTSNHTTNISHCRKFAENKRNHQFDISNTIITTSTHRIPWSLQQFWVTRAWPKPKRPYKTLNSQTQKNHSDTNGHSYSSTIQPVPLLNPAKDLRVLNGWTTIHPQHYSHHSIPWLFWGCWLGYSDPPMQLDP